MFCIIKLLRGHNHGLACTAFLCSPPLPLPSGWMSHFAKTWVSLQTTTYISKSTKYYDTRILLLLTCEEVLHAPTVQIWAQNSTILTPNNILIVCHSSITNWSQNIFFRNGDNFPLNSERVFFDRFHYKILNSCEIDPKTGAGDGAVRQARTLFDSLHANIT